MLKVRVIPCLLLRDGGLVKTEKFRKDKYIGDPINAVRIFNEKEVDELIFIDIDASKKKKPIQYDVIADLASECFMPLTYGGGINNLQQIEQLLRIGIEKVVINYYALINLTLIKDAVKQFGSSTIIGGIDVKKNLLGRYTVFNHVNNKIVSKEPSSYAKELEEAGAGEIFLNNVDRDGTYSGYDIKLINAVTNGLSIPLIACGGASSLDDFQIAVVSGASAVAAGSLFVYQGPHRAVLISYPAQKDLNKILYDR